MPNDREPLLKDRIEAEPTARRKPDIVVGASAEGHVADAKPTVR